MSRQSKSGLIKSTSKWKAYTYSLGIFVLSFMTAFLAASVFNTPNNTNAEEGDNTSSAPASGYNLSVSATSSVNLNLSVSDSDTMTISEGYVSVITNSPGYRLYISMTGDNTSLTGVKDGLSSTIAATSGTIAAPASLTRGTWGYAIPSGTAHLVSNSFSDSYSTTTSTTPDSSKLFAVPPVASSNPALLASSTSSTAGDTYPVFYAVQANSDTAPGNYTNNIAFTAVADAGTVEKVTVTPNVINPSAAATVNVVTTLYSTADYVNANISLGDTQLSCSKTSGTPLSYNCSVPATIAGTYTLSVSVPVYSLSYSTVLNVAQSIFSISTMQEMTPNICDATTIPSASATSIDTTGIHAGDPNYVPEATLRDTRDNNTYVIRKLADGNCWMVQNLALGKSGTTYTLTSSDSDVSADFELPAAQTSGNTSWGDAANTNNEKHVYATGNTNYGNYYNWYTATAGTGTGDMVSPSATNLINASSSICPKGWRLPDGGQSPAGSFYALDTALGGDGSNRVDAIQVEKFQASPYSYPFSGNYNYSGGLSGQNSLGHWWSRSVHTRPGDAYNFRLNNDGHINPHNNSNVGYGYAVRCLARTFWSISNLQDMTSEIVSSVATPSTTAPSAVTTAADYAALTDKTSNVPQRTLYDIRDGETYRVRKLADGNVWMTENLRLTLEEGKAIEISDGSMWLPTNYDGSTTSSTTFTLADIDTLSTYSEDGGWHCASPGGQHCNDIVRSLDTTGASSYSVCDPDNSGQTDKIPGTEECYETDTTLDGEVEKIGIYYNWYTATAGQGTVARNVETTISICPKGWLLPRANTLNNNRPSWRYLMESKYGIVFGSTDPSTADVRVFPFSFIMGGYYQPDNYTIVNQHFRGRYSSPQVVHGSNDAEGTYYSNRYLAIGESFVTGGTNRKRNGYTIRCAISGN